MNPAIVIRRAGAGRKGRTPEPAASRAHEDGDPRIDEDSPYGGTVEKDGAVVEARQRAAADRKVLGAVAVGTDKVNVAACGNCRIIHRAGDGEVADRVAADGIRFELDPR